MSSDAPKIKLGRTPNEKMHGDLTLGDNPPRASNPKTAFIRMKLKFVMAQSNYCEPNNPVKYGRCVYG